MLLERTISDSALVALLFLAIGITFLIIKKISPSKVGFIISSFVSNREFKQHLKEEYFIKNYTTFFLSLVSSFSIATCLTLTLNEVHFDQLFMFFSSILVFLGIKVLLSYVLTKSITPFQTVIKSVYTFEVLFLVIAGVIFLLFIPIEIFYSVHAIRGWVFAILILVYAVKTGKQFLYSVEHKTPLFYIILYFCAFEIIPALTLLKMLDVFE